jgi:hypothetical protein
MTVKVAFLFLIIRPIKNPIVWANFFKGYEEYYTIYAHISGPDYDKKDYWPEILWNNRVETHGINHVATAWGTISLVSAEGLLYEAALKNRQNKFFCLVSESDIPLWSFPDFYNMLNKRDKSYITIDLGRGDEDLFKECFPEKYIPSTNFAKSINERDYRKILLRTAHQWKILVRREAKEFVKMCKNKKYMEAYEKCFIFDPERLAPDEYAFANWLILKYGRDYIKKNIINVETTFVSYDERKKVIHPIEYKRITSGIKYAVCEDKKYGKPYPYPMFARKFAPNSLKLLKDIPVNCEKKKKRSTKKK